MLPINGLFDGGILYIGVFYIYVYFSRFIFLIVAVLTNTQQWIDSNM